MKYFTKDTGHPFMSSYVKDNSGYILVYLFFMIFVWVFTLSANSQNLKEGTGPVIDDASKTACSFAAIEVDNKFVMSSWSMKCGTVKNHFTVERSWDGVNFETAGNVVQEFSNNQINYSFLDEQPFDGTSYYRLKQTEENKNVIYSPVIEIKLHKLKFNIFPNPASSHESVTVTVKDLQNQEVVIQLFDMSGKRVLKKNTFVGSNDFGIEVNLNGQPAGLYTMTISSEYFFEKQNLTIY